MESQNIDNNDHIISPPKAFEWFGIGMIRIIQESVGYPDAFRRFRCKVNDLLPINPKGHFTVLCFWRGVQFEHYFHTYPAVARNNCRFVWLECVSIIRIGTFTIWLSFRGLP